MFHSILPMLQAAAGYTREYTGAWALLGAGIGAGLAASELASASAASAVRRRKRWLVSRKPAPRSAATRSSWRRSSKASRCSAPSSRS